MPDLVARFNRFHTDISLGTEQRDRIQRAVRRLRTYTAEHDELGATLAGRLFLQGSYKQNSGVIPLEGEGDFDVDVILPLDQDRVWRDHNDDARQVMAFVERCLADDKDYRSRLIPKDRCVRIDYKGDFHVDVTPAVPKGEHHRIPDAGRNQWIDTNPRGLDDWVKKINGECDGKFTRAMKFLKRWRDLKFAEGERIPSVAFTVFAGRHHPYTGKTPGNRHAPMHTSYSSSDAAFVTDLLLIMGDCLRHKQGRFEIPNPSLDGEDLARHWPSKAMEQFKVETYRASRRAENAYKTEDTDEAAAKWQAIFGPDFPLEP